MKYNILGNTGLQVSSLCLGTMNYGGKGFFGYMGNLDQTAVDEQIKMAIDAGVNCIDTANIYSEGLSEIMIGNAIKNLGIDRNDLVLATKVRGTTGTTPNSLGLSKKHILQEVEASLKRLGTDYLDLYQIHTADPLTPIEETLRTLDDLVRSGKIRYFGASNLSAWQMMKGLSYSQYNGLDRFASLQVNYSLDVRDVEREIVPMLLDQKIGMMVWSPLSGGLLTGKYKRNGQKDEGRLNSFPFPPFHEQRAYDVLDVLVPMAEEKNTSIAQLALAWVMQQPAVSTVIIGATKPHQLQDNLKATNVIFTPDELIQLNKVSDLPIEYPGNVLDIMTLDRRSGIDFQKS
ncbi:aldo/keto reductase [Flavobacterium turcicum]|uniref:Aldo/keto reductase n=1 Tax=Flavobacterium turcicum TaxID=2764718 RepID=A0ABR7JFB3_9FLAO|nr:aldo/keto reductase [Flavobacterium turcicum]MBC5863178.1 aldo/keto reductase [Flavobacterium turcicum]NHL01910.1 aldo/keto reductase [Flavobacterium turcicum]